MKTVVLIGASILVGVMADAVAVARPGQVRLSSSTTLPPSRTVATPEDDDDSGLGPQGSRWDVGMNGEGVEAAASGVEPVRGADEAGADESAGGSQRPVDCLTIELDPATEGLGSVTPGLHRYEGAVEPAGEVVEGHRYYQECWYLDSGHLFYADVWDQGPPAEPGVNARVLAQSAMSRTPFPVPVPHTAPSADAELITGVATWLWLDPASWVPIEANAESAGVSVTVTATPVRAEWDMGDGTIVECDGPGLVWNIDGPNPDASDCSHIFQYASADQPGGRYAGSVGVVWSIAWEASTGETGTLPDGRSTSPLSLNVTEMQAVVTYDS